MFADTAQRLLDHVATELGPDQMLGLNRIVGPANGPAWDCPMLYVSLFQVSPVLDAYGCVSFTDATYRIGIIDTVCTVDDMGNAPSAQQVTSDGIDIMARVWPLLQAIESFDHEAVGAVRLTVRQWTPRGPSGGMAGGEWLVNLRWVS